MGFFRSFIQVPVPLVLAEYNLKKVPAAMGLFMVTSGIMCLIVVPFIGWIRDATDSYMISIYTLCGLHVVFCVLPWTLEYFFRILY